MENNSVKCNVSKCKHNKLGCKCNLSTICVTCGNNGKNTCCGDYEEN